MSDIGRRGRRRPRTRRRGNSCSMAEPTYTVRALDRSTWPAFAALVEANNGIFGGCWCIGFHPEGGDKAATAAVNRERKLERVRPGRPMRRSSSMATTASAGASSGRPTSCHASRTAPPTRRVVRHRRTGGSPAATPARDTAGRAWPRPPPRRARTDRRSGGGSVEGYPEDAARCPPASSSTGRCRPTRSSGSSATARSASTDGSSPSTWRRHGGRRRTCAPAAARVVVSVPRTPRSAIPASSTVAGHRGIHRRSDRREPGPTD